MTNAPKTSQRADALALVAMLEARVAELTSEVKQGRAATARLEAELENERERNAALRRERDHWYFIATEWRGWWLKPATGVGLTDSPTSATVTIRDAGDLRR